MTDEEFLNWYNLVQEYESTERYLPMSRFCTEKKVDLIKFRSKHYRFISNSKSNPEKYEELKQHIDLYRESGLSRVGYCKASGIEFADLAKMITHLNDLERIAKIKGEVPDKPPRKAFIQIPKSIPVAEVPIANPAPPIAYHAEPQPEPEVLEKQNDIELMITKGIRVLISPNIESLKIIKIIELLKDI